MPWNPLRKLALPVVLLAASLQAGCFLMAVSGVFAARDGSLVIKVRTGVTTATCVDDGNDLQCYYTIRDADGFPVAHTSSATLISEFGVLGVLVDPLVLQIPEDLRVNAASYDIGDGLLPLEILVTGSVPVDAETILLAEPGQKLVIFELPDSVGPLLPPGDPANGLPAAMQVEFERTRSPGALFDPLEIKAMFTLPYRVGETDYYLPMLPCVTDFAQVPPILVDPAAPNQDLLGAAFAAAMASQGCTGQLYDFLSLGPLALPSVGELDFGPVLLGQSRARVLTIKSGGFSDLTVTGIQAPASPSYSIVRDDCTGIVVPVGMGCEIEIGFQPSATGVVIDSITVMTDDFSIPTTQVQITGEGATALPDAGASCGSAHLGRVGEGAPRTLRTAVWNSGGSNLAITQAIVGDRLNFSIGPGGCSGAVLAPSFGCVVEVLYQPPAAGSHATRLTVATSEDSIVVDLAGESEADLLFNGGFESLCVAGSP